MPHTTISQRALIVTLKSPLISKSSAEIAIITGVSSRQINRIYAKAIENGFEPNTIPLNLCDEHLQDLPRSGRPKKANKEAIQSVIKEVSYSKKSREMTTDDIANKLRRYSEIQISGRTVHRILRQAGYRKTKTTKKPGLTTQMKKIRLEWCLAHQDWTLEDWKNVIWSDETSVLLCQRQGGYRIWRLPSEQFEKTCVRPRYKGYSEFLFWGCFSWDKKGPCYIWSSETKKEKEKSETEILEINKELELIMKEK